MSETKSRKSELARWYGITNNVSMNSIVATLLAAAFWLSLGGISWLKTGQWFVEKNSVCNFLGIGCQPYTGWAGWDALLANLYSISFVAAIFWICFIVAAISTPISHYTYKAWHKENQTQ